MFDLARDLGSYQRVQRVFQPRSGRRIGENDAPQRAAIDLAVGPQNPVTKGVADRDIAGLAHRRQGVCHDVGVDDLDAQRRERVRHRRLAASDATGQADDVGAPSHGYAGR